jgi:hypothetical protein
LAKWLETEARVYDAFFDAGRKDGDRLGRDVCRAAAAALRRASWVPVGERLPEANDSRPSVDCEGCDDMRVQVSDGLRVWDCHWADVKKLAGLYGITHWMPLPEPPEVTR